jgi:hypothetical protein
MGDSRSVAGAEAKTKNGEKQKNDWRTAAARATNDGVSKTPWPNVNLYRSYRKFSIIKLLNLKMGEKGNNNGKRTVRTATEAT